MVLPAIGLGFAIKASIAGAVTWLGARFIKTAARETGNTLEKVSTAAATIEKPLIVLAAAASILILVMRRN